MSDDSNVFSWKRDFKQVNWGNTLKYNFYRSAGAGIVWMFFILMADGLKTDAFGMLFFPVAYFLSLLPFGLILGWLHGLGVPFVGLPIILFALLVAVGDPLVFILWKLKPRIIPVNSPKFISLQIVIFVLNEVDVEPAGTKAIDIGKFSKN